MEEALRARISAWGSWCSCQCKFDCGRMKAMCPRISRCSSDSVSISYLSLQQKWPFSYQNGSRQKDTYSTFNKAFFGDVGTIMRASELWGSHQFVFSCCLVCDVERSCCVCSFVQFWGGAVLMQLSAIKHHQMLHSYLPSPHKPYQSHTHPFRWKRVLW